MMVWTMMRARLAVSAAIVSLAAACAAGPSQPVEAEPVAGAPAASLYASSGHAAMDAWREAFHRRAVADGRDEAIVRALLTDIEPLSLYLGAQTARTGVADQAEFAKPIWEYLDSAVSDTRRENGVARLNADLALMNAIEARYGVDKSVVAAIWGMETSYGSYIGDFDAAETLANMAVEGRRRAFAETELLSLIRIVERGDATPPELKSGWAGAMGQTQFMPSTYLVHAVDWESDGRRDVWSSRADALASAANYLSASGYRPGQPWGIEVITPTGFDFSVADGQERRLSTWEALGLFPLRGGGFEAGGADYAELWLPAGATGPKYLLFENFNVFKTYNRSDSYALAVGLLADAVAGKPGPATPWPTDAELLTVSDIEVLQARLNAMGYDAGAVDGIAGRGTRRALQRFQKDHGVVADGFPTRGALDVVIAASQTTVSSTAAPG
ncbi:MAG: lytic murein transglycosylase [Pseudomonadota bacterium]